MATVTKVPTGAASAAGGVFNGSWSNEGNARGAGDTAASGDGLYATAAPGKNQEFASVWPVAFTAGEIPDGSTINSVTVKVQWKASVNTSVAELRSALFADSAQATALSAVPGFANTSEPLSDFDNSYSASTQPTVAQLRSGVWVRVQALRGNSNTAVTLSLDYIQVTVDYTAPAPPTGTAALTVDEAVLAASGSVIVPVTGSGALSVDEAALAGSGVERFTGTSAVAVDEAVLAASGQEKFTGTGALSVDEATVAATGSQTNNAVTGTGAVSVDEATVAGTGVERISGSSSLLVDEASVSASGTEKVAGTGSVISDQISLSGAGVVAVPVSGTAAVTVDEPVLSAVGEGPGIQIAGSALEHPVWYASGLRRRSGLRPRR
jgi:hypothetical protein